MYGHGVKKPTSSIIGTTHQFKIAPPVKITSVRFMAISILTIDIKLIPNAVLNALEKSRFCLNKIIVSKIILVIKPFIIARVIMPRTGKGILVN